MKYKESLTEAMGLLGHRDETVFVGQAVRCSGSFMSSTFDRVPHRKRIEFPVAEELQLGASIGIAFGGLLPVCVFPRWNFLLLAANQLVNHLDKMPDVKVIIRVGVGGVSPLDPGPQHSSNFSHEFRSLCPDIPIYELLHPEQIIPRYMEALHGDGSAILVEFGDYYSQK